ncbi:MAG TPA: 3-methyl-2-oxobutanoate dehydrogenase subunit beta [Anaerolineaceae bacterium]|jgi:2-oxoglutarate ferredoxin oxidoreductase subunit alpha|nr:3-methyl-2-oxobutanoate dehydrogenase subunit beta [Anaerolineaceae bacterium]
MAREFMKGNEAIAEAAVRAGVAAYFGYPITPQTELLEYMSHRMPELGRAFVQAESELATINMVYGAACTGQRVMSSSSSPGVSLMMEGVSYIAGTEIPVVLVDVMRGGPGLGNIAPAQGDYNQIVHGGGHGDYHNIVLAPSNVQEAVDFTVLAFDLAEKYRSVTVVLLDGMLGQMMEPCELPPMKPMKTEFEDWAVNGAKGRERRFLTSINLDPAAQEVTNFRLLNRWQQVEANEIRYKKYFMEDARFAVVAYGSSGRISLSAVRAARAEGIPVGLIRPITVSPFPTAAIREASKDLQGMLVVEMSSGQMLEDVLAATRHNVPTEFFGRIGGMVPYPDEVLEEIRGLVKGPLTTEGHPRERWLKRMAERI